MSSIGGYAVESLLGEGGMGKVFKAKDTTLDRPVAVKVIRPEVLDQDGKERFLREARACSKINHPNVITVYAAGEDKGMPYMAMEFVQGRTLKDIVDEGPVLWQQAARWMVQLLDALDRLHAEGIVHRDLKPDNVMVTDDGHIKLMDFGLAHLQAAQTLTQAGTTLGTIPYMSPEQVQGKKAEARSDLFSMGIMLHEMLTGIHPFRGEHPMAVMYSIQNETPKPMNVVSTEFPTGLQGIVDKAMEKNVDKRYASAGEFRDALQMILGESLRTVAANVAEPTKKGLPAWVYAVIGVAIVAGVVWAFTRGGHDTEFDRAQAIALNEQGELARDAGEIDEAARLFNESVAADPTFAVPLTNLGSIAFEQREYEYASGMYSRALDADSNSVVAWMNLADIKRIQGDFASAERYFSRAVETARELNDPAPKVYNNYGVLLLLDLKRPQAAVNVLNQGRDLSPTDPDLMRNLGRAFQAMDAPETAYVKLWHQGLARNPGNEFLIRVLADHHRGAGRADSIAYYLSQLAGE